MLPRTITPLLRRSAHTDALQRVLLDINAAYNNEQASYREPAPALEKSAAAVRGQSLRGDVQLPRELQDTVDKLLEDVDKPLLRTNALELYAHLRRTSSILPPPSSYRERQALTTTYDEEVSLAFLAGLMPSMYGATLHALTTIRDRLKLVSDWEPDRMIDYGSGTGSAAWAFEAVWGPETSKGAARQYVGLDGSRTMIELSSALLGSLSSKHGDIMETGAGEQIKMDAKAYQLPIPSSSASLSKLQLHPSSSLPSTGKRTIAIAAFTLADQGTKEKRKEIVRAMWESGAEVIVVVDRGTPGGSRMVLEAREQLLSYGRRSLEYEGEFRDSPAAGSYVIAPCPHDGACPLHSSTRSFCHFSQRVQSPPFLRHTKHSSRGSDDAQFSYVAIQRGIRPTSTVEPQSELSKALASTSISLLDSAIAPAESHISPGQELEWPRVVASPMKRSGHIILEVCAASGNLERHTIPKSQGRQAYYDARKADWGDSFPHPPKNGPTPAPVGKELPTVDKFGKDRSKLRSKKLARAELKVDDPAQARRERRRKGKEGASERDRESEVQDFEVEFELPLR